MGRRDAHDADAVDSFDAVDLRARRLAAGLTVIDVARRVAPLWSCNVSTARVAIQAYESDRRPLVEPRRNALLGVLSTRPHPAVEALRRAADRLVATHGVDAVMVAIEAVTDALRARATRVARGGPKRRPRRVDVTTSPEHVARRELAHAMRERGATLDEIGARLGLTRTGARYLVTTSARQRDSDRALIADAARREGVTPRRWIEKHTRDQK